MGDGKKPSDLKIGVPQVRMKPILLSSDSGDELYTQVRKLYTNAPTHKEHFNHELMTTNVLLFRLYSFLSHSIHEPCVGLSCLVCRICAPGEVQ